MKNGVYDFLGVPRPFDSGFTLVTSPIMSPTVLACVRLTLAAYGTFFTIFRLIYEGHSDSSFFSYFTTLTYIGLQSYFWASGVQTACFALSFLHLLLHSTITTYPIVVTAVFWALLTSSNTLSTRYSAWTNISEHALNTVFAAVEIFAAGAAPAWGNGAGKRGIVLPWIHLPFLIIILGCYLGLAYVTHATQGFYVYPFLDPAKQGAKLAAYIIGIAVGETIVFVIVRYVMVGRAYLCARLLSDRAIPTYEDDEDTASTHSTQKEKPEGLDDWEEVSRPGTSQAGNAV